jgi:hypothetical protein
MITTAEQMYRYFLQLVNKEKTHVVKPATFNFLINTSNIDWVKERLPVNEFNQTLIDDLQVLLVEGDLADGIDVTTDFIFDLPVEYMHGINVLFDITIINSACFEDGTQYKQSAIIMKSDEKTVIKDSYYRQPRDSRLYYRYANSKVRLFTGKYSGTSDSVGLKMYMDYYKLPSEIEYIFEGVSSDSEFGSLQQQEIVERAVQMFLEKNRDPRYQSFLNEQAQKR